MLRPRNGLLLIALQTAKGAAAALDPTLHAVPFEAGSINWTNPFRSEQSNEVTGSMVSGDPQVTGQAATLSFRSRLKGAGAGVAYTAGVKPPHHAALQACGWRGQFLAAVAATALAAGSTTGATLANPFVATAQAYRGCPLILTGGAGAGQMPLIVDYTAGRVATLSDLMPGALDNTVSAALPANWTYAPTSPADAAARATDQPYATIGYYEDGRLWRWLDCKGILDADGASAKHATAAFNFTGIMMDDGTDAAVPTNAIVAGHSAPLLVQGTGLPPAINANRLLLPISRWSLGTGGDTESPEDPNTTFGFGSAEIGGRTPTFECDPLMQLVATRNALTDIRNFAKHIVALKLGTAAGNRVTILLPAAQVMEATPAERGNFRSETVRYQATSPGRDAYTRDGDRVICFS